MALQDHMVNGINLEEHKRRELSQGWLSERSQCILQGNLTSEYSNISYGVTQGSVLDPLLFCIYMLPLGAIMKKISFHCYTGDTQIYMPEILYVYMASNTECQLTPAPECKS